MNPFNLRSILSRGKGVFSELLAHNVIQNDISPKLLNLLEDDSNAEENKEDEQLGDDLKILLKDEKYKKIYGLYFNL